MSAPGAYPSTADRCRHCGTWFRERQHPRWLKSQRDRDRCRAAGLEVVDGKVVWMPSYLCDCLWRMRVRSVAHDLLERLLPDPAAQAVLRRQARITTKEAA